MSKIRIILCTIMLLLVAASCKEQPRKGTTDTDKTSEKVVFHRFEQVLFESTPETLPARIAETQQEFDTPLLNISPNDPQYMAMLQGFAQDPTMREIYQAVKQRYSDLTWLEKQLTHAMKKARTAMPEIDYRNFYTLVTGDFNYDNRVFLSDHDMVVCIDQYVLPQMEKYGYFGCPRYIANISDSAYMAADCMAAMARQHISIPTNGMNLLDYIIAEGKVLYFLDQVLPKTEGRYKIRYTQEQWDWMQKNEKHAWSYLLKNQLLYVSDMNQIHTFIDEAPKTNSFGNDSAPRTTDYIGWQIVKLYMKKSNSSLQELFAETNSQKILNIANYRP